MADTPRQTSTITNFLILVLVGIIETRLIATAIETSNMRGAIISSAHVIVTALTVAYCLNLKE